MDSGSWGFGPGCFRRPSADPRLPIPEVRCGVQAHKSSLQNFETRRLWLCIARRDPSWAVLKPKTEQKAGNSGIRRRPKLLAAALKASEKELAKDGSLPPKQRFSCQEAPLKHCRYCRLSEGTWISTVGVCHVVTFILAATRLMSEIRAEVLVEPKA